MPPQKLYKYQHLVSVITERETFTIASPFYVKLLYFFPLFFHPSICVTPRLLSPSLCFWLAFIFKRLMSFADQKGDDERSTQVSLVGTWNGRTLVMKSLCSLSLSLSSWLAVSNKAGPRSIEWQSSGMLCSRTTCPLVFVGFISFYVYFLLFLDRWPSRLSGLSTKRIVVRQQRDRPIRLCRRQVTLPLHHVIHLAFVDISGWKTKKTKERRFSFIHGTKRACTVWFPCHH